MTVESRRFPGINEERIEFAKRFLEQAVLEGADTHPPSSRRPSRNWKRDTQILKEYVQTPSLLERDMAKKYHLGHNEIKRIIRVTMGQLRRNCSPETQSLFPREKLLLYKRHKRSNSA